MSVCACVRVCVCVVERNVLFVRQQKLDLQEKVQVKQELSHIQKAYQELEHKEKQDQAEKEKLQM